MINIVKKNSVSMIITAKEIKKRSKSIQVNLDNFDKDIQKEKGNFRLLT